MKNFIRVSKLTRIIVVFLVVLLGSLALTSCYDTPRPLNTSSQPGAINASASAQTQASPSPGVAISYGAAGVKTVKIYFKASETSGSFDAPSAKGTEAKPGAGLQAIRLFSADGTVMSSGGPSAPTWPRWLTAVELGVSGSNNVAAPSADCARFSAPGESSASQCKIVNSAGVSKAISCGGPSGFYRVSEVDCAGSVTANGDGGPGDGVYVRVQLNRDPAAIEPGENLLAILEFSASGLHSAPVQPSECVQNGKLTPEFCSDTTWKAFIKHSSKDVVQPFLLVAPPLLARMQPDTALVGGSEVQTKQIVIPLASDPALSVFQLSRTSGADPTDEALKAACLGGKTIGNSPLCAGMILYSLTLMRF